MSQRGTAPRARGFTAKLWGTDAAFGDGCEVMRRAAWPVLPPLALLVAALAGCVDKADLPRPVVQADPDRGLEIMREVGCASCHKVPGIAWPEGRTAGNLAGFGSRPLIAGRLPNQPEVLVRWVINPPSLDPETGMPPMPLTQAQARDVAAYLYELDDD